MSFFCEKIFSVKGYLTGHECTYTGNKPCQCKFCKKGFSQNGNINEHILRENSFKFKFYEKRCSVKVYLTGHERIHIVDKQC